MHGMESLRMMRRTLRARLLNRRLENKNFTLISDDCWGGSVYRELGLPYLSPFIGLFVPPICFMQLLKNLRRYMSYKPIFVESSRFDGVNKLRSNNKYNINYPIAILGEDVELHFVHYANAAEASEKWKRRTGRINWDNMLVKLIEWIPWCEDAGMEILEEFDSLQYPKKICFTWRNYPQLKSAIWLEGLPKLQETMIDLNATQMQFDVVNWINNGSKECGRMTAVANKLLHGSLTNFLRRRSLRRMNCLPTP